MSAKYQIYKDIAGKFRFRLRAENNKIVAVSEAYEQKAGVMNGVKSVQDNCGSKVEDLTVEGERLTNPKYQVFTDDAAKYRFNLSASNGEIIAASEAYETKAGCLNGIEAVQKSCNAETEDLTATAKPVKSKIEPEAPPIVGVVDSTLELFDTPKSAAKDTVVAFRGRLARSDTGDGIEGAKIELLERDRSFFNDDLLAQGMTKKDGSFSLDWKARTLDWWDNSVEIYTLFNGNDNIKPSKSEVKSIKIE